MQFLVTGEDLLLSWYRELIISLATAADERISATSSDSTQCIVSKSSRYGSNEQANVTERE